MTSSDEFGPVLEVIPSEEAEQVREATALMGKLVDRRYRDQERFLRGVHPKDQGCVEATFTLADDIRSFVDE